MAELFLQELDPEFISRPTNEDVGYDLLVGFLNKKGGINTFALEVKATEQAPVGRFQVMRRTYNRFANSNIPGLLLVADVKQNRLYYGWLSEKAVVSTANVSVHLAELNNESKAELRRQFAAESRVAAAG